MHNRERVPGKKHITAPDAGADLLLNVANGLVMVYGTIRGILTSQKEQSRLMVELIDATERSLLLMADNPTAAKARLDHCGQFQARQHLFRTL